MRSDRPIELDFEGFTPLMFAVMSKHSIELIDALIKNNADVSIRTTSENETVLHLAA